MIPTLTTREFNLNIEGKPGLKVDMPPPPKQVAVLPEHIPFVKPRLTVKEGDHVRLGGLLFEDKRNPIYKFRAPGCGIIENIHYGRRRVIKAIVIHLDDHEEQEHFLKVSHEALQNKNRTEIIEKIIHGGLWPFIRELPYRDIASPNITPPVILVNLSNNDPFHPEPSVYLAGQEDNFRFGLEILGRLCERIRVFVDQSQTNLPQSIKSTLTDSVKSTYPADDPGVFLYHKRTSSADNRAWFISGQDLLLIAHLLKTGTYPTERVITLSDNKSGNRVHLKTRLGAPVSNLGIVPSELTDSRIIAGGILRGYAVPPDGYLGMYETSISVIPEGNAPEFFGFARPGFKKPSRSRTFLSVFNKKPLPMDCNLHGEVRACVNCSYCANICPVDILPQFTLKNILMDEVEESLAHGLLDCVECGLCTYVCPSKIEICDTLKSAKKNYYLDQAK